MKPVPTRKVRRLLAARGCSCTEASGDHEKWTTPGGLADTITQTKEQSPGLLRHVQATFAAEFGDRWLEEDLRR